MPSSCTDIRCRELAYVDYGLIDSAVFPNELTLDDGGGVWGVCGGDVM